MKKYYYKSEVHKLEMQGKQIVDTLVDDNSILFNTWLQRGYCKVENGVPVISEQDAYTAISNFGYQSLFYHTNYQPISIIDAATFYWQAQTGEVIFDIPKRDAHKVLKKVIK